MKELGLALGLEEPPAIMECFDISNVSSNHIVASMVRFTNGKPDNKAYRRYRIRTVDGQNDFASMSEVIRRRYSRILAESDAVASRPADMTLYQWLKKLSGEGKAPIKVPDLVVVDGGKGQLSSALADLEAIGLGDHAHRRPRQAAGGNLLPPPATAPLPAAQHGSPQAHAAASATKPTASPTAITNCFTGSACGKAPWTTPRA